MNEEDREQVEGDEGISLGFDLCGSSVSPKKTSKKLELTHPLYSGHDWRTKTLGLIGSRLTPAILRHLRISTPSVDMASRHQERRITTNAEGSRAANTLGIRVVKACITSKTPRTQARTNHMAHSHRHHNRSPHQNGDGLLKLNSKQDVLIFCWLGPARSSYLAGAMGFGG